MLCTNQAVLLEQCRLKKCAVLQDLEEQILGNRSKLFQEHFSSFLSLYSPINALVLVGVKNMFGLNWIDTFLTVRYASAVLISTGVGYWLFRLLGPASAGLAMIFLAGIRFPEQGFNYIAPSNITMGLFLLFWGVLIHRRGDIGLWFPIVLFFLLGVHPIAVGFAGVTMAAFLVLRPWPLNRRDLLLLMAAALTFLIERVVANLPTTGYNIILNAHNTQGFDLSGFNFPYALQLSRYLMSVLGLGKESLAAIILVTLGIAILRKDYIFPAFFLLLSMLCLAALFHNSGAAPSATFERYWFCLGILLTTVVAHFSVLILTIIFYFLKKRFIWLSSANHRSGRLWSIPPMEPMLALLCLGIIASAQAIHQQAIHRHNGMPTLAEKVAIVAQSGNYQFDPNQPPILKHPRHPCSKVLYVNGGKNFFNEANNLLLFSYLAHGATDCGAILYSVVTATDDKKGQLFFNKHRQDITHVAFINQVHVSPVPVTVAEGNLRFQFWKEMTNMPWRFLFHNPGTDTSIITLERLTNDNHDRVEVARFTLKPKWHDWVQTWIPHELPGQYHYIMNYVEGGDPILLGMRFGNEKTDLLWPWNQGVEMNFISYRLERKRQFELMDRATRFTVAELAPELGLTGQVVSDRGFSALAIVGPNPP
ncbi:MAG: hypothetical protein HQL73_01150 [Magnetococcales bacterium]|nr:hypothetical protein [Magnetococcales bacterium]